MDLKKTKQNKKKTVLVLSVCQCTCFEQYTYYQYEALAAGILPESCLNLHCHLIVVLS